LTQIAEYTVKRLALLALVFLFVLSVATPFIPTAKATSYGSFPFFGPLSEDQTGYMLQNITITAHLAGGTGNNAIFEVNDTNPYIYNDTVAPVKFFTFDWNGTGTPQHREYWLDPTEQTAGLINNNIAGAEYDIYFSRTDLTTYIISFMDQVGLLKQYPYIELQAYLSGQYVTVDKREVDAQNIISCDLQMGSRYRIIFTDGITDNIYGDITTTATTGIQLILRGVDFPKETLLLYQYVHASAIRDFLNPTGAITVSYEDITNQTTSVTLTITNNGTVVYNNVFVDQTFSYTWTSAVNATSYQVTVAIVHANFGSFSYKYYLLGEYTKATEPFSLAFLGSTMGISTAVLIPALLIIFVAGCFSEITAETAAVLTVIVAIILSALGWIEISQAAIITALALSVLAGIVTAKRRMSAY
jgi:hypothetical protein